MRPTDKSSRRSIRHHRSRAKLNGTTERPRLAVYRSLRHIYAQLIDDEAGKTIVSASTQCAEIKDKIKNGGNKEAAARVGELIARRAGDKGIKRICFDRAGFSYHGCVAALADSARKAGLEF